MDITNPMLYAVPLFPLFIFLEWLLTRKEKNYWHWKDFLSSISMGAGSLLFGPFTKMAAIIAFGFLFEATKEWRLETLGYEQVPWAWWGWVLVMLCDDLSFYWHHRLSHTVRVLWAAHVVHHSSEHFNYGTSVRNGWFTIIYKPMFWMWLPLLGFHPIMIATAISLNAVYQFFLHSEKIPSFGPLEKVFNTPYLHQVHHACNVNYLDRNHGGILVIWDRLFGTFQDVDPNEKPKFGVLHPPQSYNPLVIATHEYSGILQDLKTAKTWKERFFYVFGPPGWSPDGSRKTAKQMQWELAATGKVEGFEYPRRERDEREQQVLSPQPVAAAPRPMVMQRSPRQD